MARVLITGCSTGIGRATATELARRGHDVVATARRPETLEGLDVDARLPLDVDDAESVAEALTAAGPLDVLVNNAGYEVSGPVERVPLHEIRDMFETNYFSVVRLVQEVVPGMRERGRGTIVNVSSVAGLVAAPFGAFYSGTKHAIEALSEAMHYELGHFGIHTIVVEPGVIATSFAANVHHHGDGTAPYDELRDQWDGATDRLRGGGEPPGPDVVAAAIADAIAADPPPRRVLVGADAELVADAKRTMDDPTFESTMRETLGITW